MPNDFTMPVGHLVPMTRSYEPSFDTAPTDAEARCGVESLDVLHAERREIADRLAPLNLLWGSGGDRADAKRKQHRQVIGELIRKEIPGGEDLAMNRIEAMANADPRHRSFCDELDAAFTAWSEWTTRLKEIDERIEARQLGVRQAIAEMRLI